MYLNATIANINVITNPLRCSVFILHFGNIDLNIIFMKLLFLPCVAWVNGHPSKRSQVRYSKLGINTAYLRHFLGRKGIDSIKTIISI
jgi:hypothetical protein